MGVDAGVGAGVGTGVGLGVGGKTAQLRVTKLAGPIRTLHEHVAHWHGEGSIPEHEPPGLQFDTPP